MVMRKMFLICLSVTFVGPLTFSIRAQQIDPTQVNGTALVETPSANQTIRQPFGTTLAINSLNGIFNEELFPGNLVGDRIAAAVTACAGAPCIIVIPPNAPQSACSFINVDITTACWASTPNNVIVQDQRHANGSGQVKNALNLEKSPYYIEYHAGANDSFEQAFDSGHNVFSISAFADGGTDGGRGQNWGNLLAFFSSASRSHTSSRSIWGNNTNVAFYSDNVATALATGYEVDMSNFSTSGETNLQNSAGFRGIAGGVGRVGIGMLLNSQGNPNTGWIVGEAIDNYGFFGIRLLGDPGRSADIYITPPADDNSLSVIGRNHADTETTWSVDSSGNGSFQQLVSTKLYANSSVGQGTGIQHRRGIVGCTTAPVAGATCTSGGLSWAIGFPDTNYTLTCTLESPLGVPTIAYVNKGTTTFTITLAALTNAGASGQYNCIAMHD